MKRNIVILSLLSVLVGCNEELLYPEGFIHPEPPTTPDVTLPDITRPTHYSAVIKSGSQQIVGDVNCNGVNLDTQGEVVLAYDEHIACQYGNVTLAEFSPIWS